MHIEVWEGNGGYFWHFRSRNGKITADSESFPSKGHAIRAAKAVVRGTCRQIGVRTLRFTSNESAGVARIAWW